MLNSRVNWEYMVLCASRTALIQRKVVLGTGLDLDSGVLRSSMGRFSKGSHSDSTTSHDFLISRLVQSHSDTPSGQTGRILVTRLKKV